ncbi:hypothetical protein N665_0844s0006 [Sinapis alba]|nr:hypothetical protein N665_0844s0006 [Sinapis alba]
MGRWLHGQNRPFRFWTRVLGLITQRYYLCFLHRWHCWWICSSFNPRWFLSPQETSFGLYLSQHSSWRYLYLYTAVPATFYCIFLYLFALESPRSLHIQGNDEEAIKVLKSMSSNNKPYLESLVYVLPLKQETTE